MAKFKINGLIDHPRWYDIPCKCDHNSVETEFPIKECLHCKFEQQEKSLPHEEFEIIENTYDKNNNITGDKKRTIKEINIFRGGIYEDIIGWSWN